MINVSELLFTIAAILWIFSLLPQIKKTYKSKRSEDLSVNWLYINLTAYICFISGYWVINDIFMFIMYLMPTCIVFTLLCLVKKYKIKRK